MKTYGQEVVDFMDQIGRPLDPWQAAIILDAFGVMSDGLWSAYELLILLSRQNGKGGATEAIELGGLFLFREPLIMHSAHQFKTSTAAFRRLQDIIDGSDWLTRRVKMISRSKGDESIELTRAAGGGRLQFVARTLGSGRGLTGSKNVFDEAWALTVGQYAAQTPALATIPNPQIIYTTTPPDDDIGPVPAEAMLPSVRQRAIDGDERIAVYEWSPPERFDRHDPDVWYQCNPALGIRMSEWFLAKQLKAFEAAGKPEKFDTEHLGLWPLAKGSDWRVIPEALWNDARDRGGKQTGRVALAVDVTPDRSWAAITAAGKRDRSGRQVEVTGTPHGGLDHRPGVAWVIPRLKEIAAKAKPCVIVVNDRALADAARQDKIDVHLPSAGDMVSACAGFFDGVAGADLSGRDVHHLGQPPLTAAVAGATKRTVGDAWAWDRRSVSVDICPLVAASLALWGLGQPRLHKRGFAPRAASV